MFNLYTYSFGFLTFHYVYHAIGYYKAKKETGSFFTGSAYIIVDENGNRKFFWAQVGAIIFRTFLGFSCLISIQGTVANAARADASMSVVASLFSSAMFMTAISFYFIFGEKINAYHIAGMLIMFASAILISFKPPREEGQQSSYQIAGEPISIWWAIGSAFSMAFFQTLIGIFGRIQMNKTGISAIQYTTDSFSIMAYGFVIAGLYHHFYVQPYEGYKVILTTCAGLCLLTAISLFHEAVTYGKGGPALALSQIQTIVFLVLEIFV